VTQGESVSMAIESITKASHLNVTKNVANAVGSQMAMQSSLFGRLGKKRTRQIDRLFPGY
jgi:anaphase-promoting complex subunit 5